MQAKTYQTEFTRQTRSQIFCTNLSWSLQRILFEIRLFFSRTEDPYSYFTCSSMNLFYQSFRYLLCCYKICLAGCFHMINSGKNPSGSQYRTGHIKYNHAPDSGFSFFLGACGYYSKFGSFTEDRRPRFHILPVVA